MSEQQQLRSPLDSERGVTTIKDGVVSRIASMAAREVEGVYLGGSASRAAGGFLENVTGSSGGSRGVSVEVGRVETAIDLKMGIEYGRNILEAVEEVRRRISDRVTQMTGLRITELNVTISDVVFPGDEAGDEERPAAVSSGRARELDSGDRTQPAPTFDTTSRSAGGREAGDAETRRGGTSTEAPTGARGPAREDETTEMRREDVTRRDEGGER